MSKSSFKNIIFEAAYFFCINLLYKYSMERIIQTLNDAINNWLNSNGFRCSVKYSDTFHYDYLNQIISYTLFNDEDEDRLFLEICKSIYCDIDNYNKFIIYFFRQLGYNATQSHITQFDREEKEKLKNIKNPTEDQKLAYYVSFAEWEAIDWACKYIKNNKNKVIELYNIIKNAKEQIDKKLKEDIEVIYENN